MGDPVVDNLKKRQAEFSKEVEKLAYERLRLTRRIEEIDKLLEQLEGAQLVNEMVRRDIDLRETIDQAQKEAADKKATEKINTEV